MLGVCWICCTLPCFADLTEGSHHFSAVGIKQGIPLVKSHLCFMAAGTLSSKTSSCTTCLQCAFLLHSECSFPVVLCKIAVLFLLTVVSFSLFIEPRTISWVSYCIALLRGTFCVFFVLCLSVTSGFVTLCG